MEKRKNTRIVFNVTAIVRFMDKDFEGNIINLSLKGMLIKLSGPIPENSKVNIKMYMEGDSSKLAIDIEGQVLRTDNKGTAVIFSSMDIDSFIHLRNIVAYNEGDEDKIMKEFYASINQSKE